MDIQEALATLDPEDSSLWTADGLPKVEVVRELVEDSDITRADITDAAPQFTRDNPIVEIEEEEGGDDDAEEEGVREGEEEVTSLDELELSDPVAFYQQLQGMGREQAQAAAEAVSAEMNELGETLKKLQEDFNVLSINLTNAKNRVQALTPRNQPQLDIMAHIKKQNELRAQKAGVAKTVREKIGNLADLDPRAPIDRAMARNRKRGTQRPARI